MLDVHPPHQPAHSWRDFFIHIATIVVGLLIAVAIEQTVEWIHHRHQLREAREAIHEELIRNHQEMQYNLALLEAANRDMVKNTALLRDPHGSDAIPTSELKYTWGTLYITSAAWDAAKANGSVDYMPLEERQTYEYAHTVAGYALQYELNYLADTKTALAIAARAPTIGGLNPDDREKLMAATAATQGQINSTYTLLHYVDSAVQGFLSEGRLMRD